MSLHRPLRIAIECRIPEARQGIGMAIIFLAHVLSAQKKEGQEYTFVVTQDLRDWLRPHLDGPCHLAVVDTAGSKWKSRLGSSKLVKSIARRLPRPIPTVPGSDGYVESQNFDLVHFPTQKAYLTSLPSVYQPWDLQHVHYPEFFSKRDLAIRDSWYRAFCLQASTICVQAEWTRKDVSQSYGIDPQKITVVPWGSTFEAYQQPSPETIAATRARYALPEQFFFYPAVTWPHKNHAVLLRTLALLEHRYGRKIHLYLTGAVTDFNLTLESLARELGVSERVHRLGFIPTSDLQGLYASATAMVFPSLFEGFGLPLLEAFHARLPVLCSDATVLPEVAQDAALYFEPTSAENLAGQMIRLLDEPDLRQHLQERGTAVLRGYNLRDTANALYSMYYSVASAASVLRDAKDIEATS